MIRITSQASKKIQENLLKRGQGIGIRVGIKTTGCSGFSYTLEYVDKYESEIGVVNYAQPEFVVLIDHTHETILDGLVMDWVRQGLNEGFEFTNPNEKSRCGCGESFQV
jgi:iron-sulfur cluster assembly protein